MGRWVCGYDVTSDRRRRRIARELERRGIRVQKSVFSLVGTRSEIEKLAKQLETLLDPRTDTISCWPVSEDRRTGQIVLPSESAPTFVNAIVID